MDGLKIGRGTFLVAGAGYAHNPAMTPPRTTGKRGRDEAALRLPLRFTMGHWDCSPVANMEEAEARRAMLDWVRNAQSQHWLRHDIALRTDAMTSLSHGAETELWRRLEEGCALTRSQIGDWAAATFGRVRHHRDLLPWMGQVMPYASFTLHLGLLPLVIALTPADDRLPRGVTLMLRVVVDGMYMLEPSGTCGTPPAPLRQVLPLRGLAGITDSAKAWSMNVAKMTARREPEVSALLGRLRRL